MAEQRREWDNPRSTVPTTPQVYGYQGVTSGTATPVPNRPATNQGTPYTPGTPGTPTTTAQPEPEKKPEREVTQAEQAAIFGIPLAIINSDPELKKLFDEAWAAQKSGMEWSQELFNIKLRNTNWYKTKTESQRKYYTLANDPAQAAEFADLVKKSRVSVQDAAGYLGTTLTDKQLDELAKTNLEFGLSEGELQNTLATYISYEGKTDQEIIGSLFGQAGNYEDTIRTWAKQNDVTVSNDWVLGQVRGIVAGDFDTNKSKDYITNIAKQQYSAWADKLDANTSVLDLAAGYRQVISDELDKGFEQIDLSDEYLKNAMRASDPNGKPISIDSLKTTIRKSDEWASVDKNKNKVLGVANDILSRFGMM